MRQVFRKRQADFRSQCTKYLRYVFNDHFVLFLLVFLGFLAIQYSQLLRNFPKEHLPIILGLGLLLLALLPLGRIATYLEKPDSLFLLVKEKEIEDYIQAQVRSSYLLWAILQTAILIFLAPLFLALGLPVWAFVLLCLLMLLAKWLVFSYKKKKFYSQSGLNWSYLIAYEDGRKQTILRFFALFTTVKGISNSVKRRKYLDGLTKLVAKDRSKTWHNMYLRSYLRNGDFFALSIRLLALSSLTILFVSQSWVAAAFAILFNYLLLFQLTALYNAFDYQYLTLLFPLDKKEKLKGVQAVIRGVGFAFLLLQVCLALLAFQEKLALLLLLGATVLLYCIYLPFKLKSLVDE